MTSTPIHRIEIGDKITVGYGTLEITTPTVIDIASNFTTWGELFTLTLDNETKIYGYPDGHWYDVTKASAESQRFADAAATAYALAWDSK